MNCDEVQDHVSAWLDGELDDRHHQTMSTHIQGCGACQEFVDQLKNMDQVLKVSFSPLQDSQHRIQSNIMNQLKGESVRRPVFKLRHLAAGVLIAFSFIWVITQERSSLDQSGWRVVAFEGPAMIDQQLVQQASTFETNQWLVTKQNARVQFSVTDIGQLEVFPQSRLQLIKTEKNEIRLQMTHGRIEARINAPPRLFFVDTPSAVAVDLGCDYQLEVDDEGDAFVLVTQGAVSLENKNRASYVPAGAACYTRVALGPGTPFFSDTSDHFKDSLNRIDRDLASEEDFKVILDASRPEDTLTLWHLLGHPNENWRSQLIDRIKALSDFPQSIAKRQLMILDRTALEHLKDSLEFYWH